MPPTINYRLPTVQEYISLRRSVEWPEFDPSMVYRALSNTLFSVVALNETGEAIGMGRVIGDNAIYFHVQDVIVRSDCQGLGVGNLVMHELLSYIDRHAGPNTNIGLMCSKGREPFYRNFGFVDRPSDKFGSGMIKVMR